jgi:hypothetical protein
MKPEYTQGLKATENFEEGMRALFKVPWSRSGDRRRRRQTLHGEVGFLERAEIPTLVVDAYIGVGTLDCFRTTKVPILLLTGSQNNSIEAGFENALKGSRNAVHTTCQ